MQERELGRQAALRRMTAHAAFEEHVTHAPLGRIACSEDVTRAVRYLARDEAVSFTGAALPAGAGPV